MYNWHSSPTLINVTFSQNSAENMGGGLLNSSDSDPALDNTILWGNTAPSGPQISNSSDSTPLVTYCDIQDSGGSGTGWDGGLGIDNGGNVDADPSFVDPSGPDGIPGTSDDNLRLRRISPAIDAASNLLIPAYVTTDLDGNARLVDTPFVADTGIGTPPIVDMGAYEFQSNLAYLPVVIVNR
jgi:predicted outer membrane repeat protein